ncbi:MAG: hypothetical protein HYR51_10745 [Candidatus Rokubacteria bacterium]|nr:hypothetical protein [Candidatus Rokubacteria bacterium]
MGMDPVQQSELYEVTVQIEGPVSVQAYAAFRAAVDTFLTTARTLTDPPGGAAGSKKIKVRESKAGVRPKSH